jgi:hypothetical protein
MRDYGIKYNGHMLILHLTDEKEALKNRLSWVPTSSYACFVVNDKVQFEF